MLIKVIEPIVYLVIIINLVIAISYKRKSKKTPVKVVAPIVILGIGLFVCDTVYTHRSFSSVEKAVEAYGDNAEIIRILQGENSTYVIMDNEGTVEGKIFPESSGKWKLPDSIFYGTGREYQDVKINIDMSTIEINGEWYVLVVPNDDNYVIADVKDSVGTKFPLHRPAPNRNKKISVILQIPGHIRINKLICLTCRSFLCIIASFFSNTYSFNQVISSLHLQKSSNLSVCVPCIHNISFHFCYFM